MNANIGNRYGIEGRIKLQEVIPLDTPFTLFVDPSSVCNFSCTFCACSKANKANWSENKKTNIMSYELFRNIIDGACEFPGKIKTLRLYKEGEPLLNKRLPDMINYARKKNVANKIDFTTNGSLLNPDLNLALIDAGLTRINISIEAMDELGYKKNSGAIIDFKKFTSNIEHLYKHKQDCHIFIKISDLGLEGYSKDYFYSVFGDICDEIAVENVTPVWPGFDLLGKTEFTKGIYGNQIREVDVCPYIFYSICINSDGSVSACLMDWNHGLIVGDVNTDSIVDIWNNSKIRKMQIDNLLGKRKEIGVCAQCGQMAYGTLDNIDKYIDELLEKIVRQNL